MFDKIQRIDSTNDSVSKFVFTKENAVAESVLYKYPTYKDRTVICCSTQSGCKVGCRFCGAGDYFVRSFTAEEIVYQPSYLLEQVGIDSKDIDRLQIMFMSMGEPMHNYDELEKALIKLYELYPNARLLISTSAPKVFKEFDRLGELSVKIPTIGLQFSVHESTDEDRRKLIPTQTMTLEEMSIVGEKWYDTCGRKPFFNYCVHENNNKKENVDNLYCYFNPAVWESTISVICERDENIAQANERQRELAADFMSLMLERGYSTRMFDPAGQDDIGGGCGQLFYVQDWFRSNPDKAKKSKGFGLPVVHMPTCV